MTSAHPHPHDDETPHDSPREPRCGSHGRAGAGPETGRGPGRLSRRRLFGVGVIGVGAWTLGRMSPAVADGTLRPLQEPGTALAPAQRVTPPPLVDPPAPGEILFPIQVGAGDSCYVLDNFGDCRGTGCSRSHEGVDIMADQGLPIMATVDGVLTKRYVDSGLNYGAGNGWTLFGVDDVTYKFFHLDHVAEGLVEGSEVVQGQVIGYVGNTGTSGVSYDPPTNYHLHFEYRPNNVPVDSFHLLQRPPHVVFAS